MSHATAVLLTGFAALIAAPVSAGFRCDAELVADGMTPLEVLERCGEPEFVLAWTDYRYPGLLVRVDQWSYHLGSNRFRRLLIFENGRLVDIEVRDKPATAAPL